MYICLKCGETFDIEDMHKMPSFTVDGWTRYEYENSCPECGSEDFTEAEECEICGIMCDPETLHAGRICDDCYQDAMTDMNVLRSFAAEDPDAFAEFLCERSKT